MNPVIETLSKFEPLTPDTAADLRSLIRLKYVVQNEMLLHTGEVATEIYFVNHGLLRIYYYHDGKDVTDYFAIDKQFIGAVPSLVNRKPSLKAIQAVEDSELFYFRMDDFDACCARHHDLERAARKLAMFGMFEEQERIQHLRFYSAKERYELMEKKYPGITNRCPLQFIASYINTSRVSISRIRAGVQ